MAMDSIRSSALALCVIFGVSLGAQEEDLSAEELPRDEVSVVLTRSDNVPKDSVDGATDNYFEGYVQALVDMHYYEYKVVVLVKERKVWLANLPKNKLTANSGSRWSTARERRAKRAICA
jgi:hypothetical protein